jgi:hypothetical protein
LTNRIRAGGRRDYEVSSRNIVKKEKRKKKKYKEKK